MSVIFEEQLFKRFDPDQLIHLINNTQMEHRLLSGGFLSAHFQQLTLGDLTINAGDYRFPFFVSGHIPHGKVNIGLSSQPTAEVRVNNRIIPLDQIQLYAPGMEFHYTTRARTKWFLIELPLERLQEIAIAQQNAELEWPRQSMRQIDLTPQFSNTLRFELYNLLRIGRSLANLPDGGLSNMLASEGLMQLLVEAISGGSSPQLRTTPSVGRRAALTALESSIECWKEDPNDSLRVTQVNATSQRLLELATREVYGVTPLQWIKLARLNAVYQELLNGHSNSVTEASEHWGFGHAGRMAIEYRKIFGESPSETLRKKQT
ncbi:MAG: AraC family transcriptional regulator [Gammaproteobacteria bacterium]|nr:AraC family transcriptional regulator [Gammaproteobacteria bacterium]